MLTTTNLTTKKITMNGQINLLRSIRQQKWRIPIQFFRDPFVQKKDKKKFVILLHQKNWIYIRQHKNPPTQLLELVAKYESREAFEAFDNQGRTALHKACLHEVPVNEIENMLFLGGKKLLCSLAIKRSVFSVLDYALMSGYIDAIEFLINHRHGGLWMVWNDHKKFQKKNALIVALECRASIETIEILLNVGGNHLVCEEYRGRDALHYALKYRSSLDIIELLIRFGGREIITKQDSLGRTKLFVALGVQKMSMGIIETLIRNGGKTMLQTDVSVPSKRLTYVHLALVADQAVKSMDLMRILQLMIEIGGKELMLRTDGDGLTPLHYLFFKHKKSKEDIVKFIVGCGGKELLMMKTENGLNHLMIALLGDESPESIQIILDAGGIELLMDKDNRGMNSFEVACRNFIDEKIVMQLVKNGGKEFCLNCSAQQCCMMATDLVSMKVFKMITYVGGAELLKKQYDQMRNVLQTVGVIFGTDLTSMFEFKLVVEKLRIVLTKGLAYGIGGEYAIGGLFNSLDSEIRKEVFGVWNRFVAPALEMDHSLFSTEPLLQAAIFHKAPQFVIAHFIRTFDCISTRDSLGRRPIDIALEHSLSWNGGLKDIIHPMAILEKKSIVHTCAKYGIKWNDGMKEVVHSNANEIGKIDEDMGLYTFMLAAEGNRSDLSSIYELIRMRPDLVTRHHNQLSGLKRSRQIENEYSFAVGKRFKQMLR